MNLILREFILVLALTLFNGFFACSEIALISLRKTRVAALVKRGSRRAQIIQQLQQNPEMLFATVQIGVSVITILTSVFAGSSLAEQIAVHLAKAPYSFIASHAYGLSFALIVVLLSYISLVLGELAPKSLGLRYAEQFALLAAYPIWIFSRLCYWLVKILNLSTSLLLKPFRASRMSSEPRLSEEEIRTVISEGRRVGAIEAQEHDIIENVFEFTDLTVSKIMVPRTQITAFNIHDPVESIIHQAVDSGFSRVPIYQNTLNNIVGILYTKKLLTRLGQNLEKIDLQNYLVPPYFVPDSMKINRVLQRLQNKKAQMALVTDEYGEIVGLVTVEDLLEELVGEISDETDETSRAIVQQPDESFIVSGACSIVDFNKQFGSGLPEDEDFSTVSGFLLDRLGRFSREGDTVSVDNLEFTVKEKTLRTVKTAVVKHLNLL